MRAMSLVFRFAVTIDDRKLEVQNRPGDAIKLRAMGDGGDLDQALAAGGMTAYEWLFKFSWQALTHHDEYTAITYDEYLDRCEAWDVLDDETGGPLRPTGAGPSSA